jgi:hypothetical protein
MRAPMTLSTLLLFTACGGDDTGRPDSSPPTATVGTSPGSTSSTTASLGTEPTPTTSGGTSSGPQGSTTTAEATSGPLTSTSGATVTTDQSETTSTASGGTTDWEVDFCECWESQPKYKSCQIAATCQTDADCCPGPLPEGFTCSDYPYNNKCVGGACLSAGCADDSGCLKYFEQVKTWAPYAVFEGCGTWMGCDTDIKTCQFSYAPSCQVDADCCHDAIPEGYTCGKDYPYIYACENNQCVLNSCEEDAQCETYYEQTAANVPGYVNKGCVTLEPEPCFGVKRACLYGMACQTANDCCPDSIPEGFTCGKDYPYLYECKYGLCAGKTCESDAQCEVTYAGLQPGYVGLGCK